MNKKPKFKIGDKCYLFAFEGGHDPYIMLTRIASVSRNRSGEYEYQVEDNPFKFYCSYTERYLFKDKEDVKAFIDDEFTRGDCWEQ